MNNEYFMRRCYELAISAGKKGHDSFGAVLVYDGKILEEAENTARIAWVIRFFIDKINVIYYLVR